MILVWASPFNDDGKYNVDLHVNKINSALCHTVHNMMGNDIYV